jgi:hypothetical protein
MQKSIKMFFVGLFVGIMVCSIPTLAVAKQENEMSVEEVGSDDVTVEIKEKGMPLNMSVAEIESKGNIQESAEIVRPLLGLLIVFSIIILSYIFLKNYVRSREDLDSAE